MQPVVLDLHEPPLETVDGLSDLLAGLLLAGVADIAEGGLDFGDKQLGDPVFLLGEQRVEEDGGTGLDLPLALLEDLPDLLAEEVAFVEKGSEPLRYAAVDVGLKPALQEYVLDELLGLYRLVTEGPGGNPRLRQLVFRGECHQVQLGEVVELQQCVEGCRDLLLTLSAQTVVFDVFLTDERLHIGELPPEELPGFPRINWFIEFVELVFVHFLVSLFHLLHGLLQQLRGFTG
jgi:hypothetical protein